MSVKTPTKTIEFLEAVVRDNAAMSPKQWKLLFQHPYRPDLPHDYTGPRAEVVDLRRKSVFEDWLSEAERRAERPLRWAGDRNSYSEALQGPEPDNYFDLELRLFRAHLRAIWEAAEDQWARDEARKALNEYASISRMSTVPREHPKGVTWNSELFEVITWLLGNCDRLKICANSDCKRRYFIRVTGYKYCSTDCRGEGDKNNHDKQRKAKSEANGPPRQQRTFSDKARQGIIDAQKRRWAKVRASKNGPKNNPA
jgi:hypothetical protein